MKRKYIFPIIKFWWKEFYNNLIQIGICGWALFGLTYLVGDYEWIGWFFIGLILLTATLSTVTATMATLKKDSQETKTDML